MERFIDQCPSEDEDYFDEYKYAFQESGCFFFESKKRIKEVGVRKKPCNSGCKAEGIRKKKPCSIPEFDVVGVGKKPFSKPASEVVVRKMPCSKPASEIGNEDEDEENLYSCCRKPPALEVYVILCDGTQTTSLVLGDETDDFTLHSSRYRHTLRFGDYIDIVPHYVKCLIAPQLIGMDPTKQRDIDKILEESMDKLDKLPFGIPRLITWAVSAAVCRAGAIVKGITLKVYIAKLVEIAEPDYLQNHMLPTPVFNITYGEPNIGNKLAQAYFHFVILPVDINSFDAEFEINKRLYLSHLKDAIDEGDQGVYIPNIKEIKKGLELMRTTIASLDCADKVFVGLDACASMFYGSDKTYGFNFKEENNDDSQKISGEALQNVYRSLFSEYSLIYIEDPFHTDDLENYSKFTFMSYSFERSGVIIKDDSLLIDLAMLKTAIRKRMGDGLLLKVSQVGSLTKLVKIVTKCKSKDWTLVMSSHTSCEDNFIADLCVGLEVDLIKIGVRCITEPCAICNRLSEIEKEFCELKERSVYYKNIADTFYFLWLYHKSPDDKCLDQNSRDFARKIHSGEITKKDFRKMWRDYIKK